VKRLIVLTGAAAALLTVAACSGGTQGFAMTPTATAASNGNSGGGSSGSQSSSGSGGKIASTDGLAATDACTLLSTNDASGLGLPSTGTKNNAGAKSGCEWDGSDFVATILIRTDVGLAGVVTDGAAVTSTKVGSHEAKELIYTGSTGCMYVIGVTDSMRVDVQAVSSSNNGCQQAQTMAQIVEAKLP
jgi:hypothetical protein